MKGVGWNALVLVAALAVSAAGPCPTAAAAPVVMTFEGVVGHDEEMIPATPYSEAGFTLTSIGPPGTDGIFGYATGYNTNGTDIFGWCADCGGPVTITLMRTQGGIFDFIGFDTAVLGGGTGIENEIDVIGYFDGGGTVTVPVTQTLTWTTITTSFVGVFRVDFVFGAGHNSAGNQNHAFDNLTMAVLAVPEPGTLALAGAALGLAGFARRRRG